MFDESGAMLRVDGARPLTLAAVEAVAEACDRAEDRGGAGILPVYVSGAPDRSWATGLDVSLVTKWERGLRRLERLDITTVAVASGDCGGPALDALLATDFRIAETGMRLLVTVEDGTTWPGMALFRLSQQVGVARTRRAVVLGHPIVAAEALSLGLVDDVTEAPESALSATAALVGAVPGKELAIRRQLMFDASTTSFEDALGAHLAACDRALRRATTGARS
ncbi:enoyl-CoA-hydratase DpgB [Amycolatopsis pittospori]|uniref:enoyl-CoA-hydratase DpgB n=1 Tax=Amycolatopsis pittospori TaxID=2749434 RepID=UPI0015F0CF90|nr:enoyl-CoA-hydratase DpgB [Amycolatopsis pittospori]